MAAKFAYYVLVLPISYLPLWLIYVFTDFFYLLLVTTIPYRKKVILGNLKRSFPDKSDIEINRIKRKFYRHFTDLLAEGIKNLSISKGELEKRFRCVNSEIMHDLFEKDKSVLLVSGHYNNWEWLISAQNFMFPHQAMGIGMPMTSKFWDKKVNERRQRFGMKVIHAKNFKEEIIKQGSNPIAILTLSDQSPGDARKSFWMKFLNQDTPVLFGAEYMANEYNFAVIFFHTRKIKRGHYEMELKLISEEPKSMNWGEITESHTHFLEEAIRSKPEFWVWSHKRWKREKPADLAALKDEQKTKFNEKFRS